MSEDEKEITKETEVDFGRIPFEFTPGDPIATLKLVGDLGPDLAKEFEKRMRSKFEDFANDLILDLSEAGTIHPIWTRSLMPLAVQVKKAHRRLKVASNNPHHKTFFQSQGIAASFPVYPDHAAATRELTAKKAVKIDVAFINPFLEGAVEVLKKQAGFEAKAGHPGARDPSAPLDGDVSGVIPLQSESFTGTVILSFPEGTYLKIMSRMLGEGHSAITPENGDGAAEIMNMIFGYAKRILNEKGHQIQVARPTVAMGKSPDSLPPQTGPRIAIPFESDAGPFSVEIRVEAV